jgi:flagellar hook assembly protein FlgD
MGRFTGDFAYQVSDEAVRGTTELRLTVSDVRGQIVWQKSVRPSQSGVREISWNGSSAPSGLYVLHVRAVQNGKSYEATQRGMKLR